MAEVGKTARQGISQVHQALLLTRRSDDDTSIRCKKVQKASSSSVVGCSCLLDEIPMERGTVEGMGGLHVPVCR